jgi:hypothetical protein
MWKCDLPDASPPWKHKGANCNALGDPFLVSPAAPTRLSRRPRAWRSAVRSVLRNPTVQDDDRARVVDPTPPVYELDLSWEPIRSPLWPRC